MANFGESLKRERELREISLREIADATKINLRYLEALEQNRFDSLPGGIFTKGFIKAYATYIGADGQALLDTYIQEMALREAAVSGDVLGGAFDNGLLRPAETPRRRAGGEEASAPKPSGNGGPDPSASAHTTQPLTLAKLPASAAKPDVLGKTAHPDDTLKKLAAAVQQRRKAEREAMGRGGSQAVLVAGSLVGGAVLVLGLLLVSRAMTRPPAEPPPGGEARASLADRPADAAADSGTDSGLEAQTEATNSAPSPDTASPAPNAPSGPPTDLEAAQNGLGASRAGEPSGIDPVMPKTQRRPAAVAPREALAPPPPEPESPRPFLAAPMVTGTPGRERTARSVVTPAGPMDLYLEATAPVLVQVSCDGEDKLNRPLLAGESASMRCFSLIRLSATDAGALRLTVSGARCAPLGESGSRVQGFSIRSDDYRSICPPGETHGDNRR